ncbi:DUF3179 domain-containing protein [Sneathiella limimaris]|uniref:DUF3179 domain-containing protein n=1 Tax=Sneathiella limimaris TaxID=1964213 RepID=UPI00146BA294|nr:DUF3179 domain-containing protein [Sneathiella limimaris]
MRGLYLLFLLLLASPAAANPEQWQLDLLKREFPKADFSKQAVPLSEIQSGGPPRDGIPAIDNPVFRPASELDLVATEPVIGVEIGGAYKAYPLRVLMWHEIANDTLGDVPITVTYCPLCNAAITFRREMGSRLLDFGTTGRLRNSDLIMYDRQTESFFQQATGRAIIGTLMGEKLKMIPSRLESFADFKARAGSDAPVLVPNNPDLRDYGTNPYEGYDEARPFLYRGEMPEGINPLERVVTTEAREIAYSLSLLREKGEIEAPDGTRFSWSPGQSTALGHRSISEGKDIGNVTATRGGKDVVYFVEFAFVFHAFSDGQEIVK